MKVEYLDTRQDVLEEKIRNLQVDIESLKYTHKAFMWMHALSIVCVTLGFAYLSVFH